jgi:signal transduction histidine kinase
MRVDADLALTASADEGVFRLVQESLTNTLRHAGTQPTSISLRRNGDGLTVRVENEGGYPAGPAVTGLGHGLVGMRERIEACGGRLASGPRPEGGFLVEAVLPGSAMSA